MPKRVPAIDDDTLHREVGHLADDLLLLPAQVTLITGLSVGQLRERLRTKPPQPPHPEPRERPREALWYSLGEVRRFRAWRAERAVLNAELVKRGFVPGFTAWLHADDHASENWPFALIGPNRRPVDAWATIRGEILMGRTDTIQWLTLDQYLHARLASAQAQAKFEERAQAMEVAKARAEEGLAIGASLLPKQIEKIRT
jgi:hypothetical protein